MGLTIGMVVLGAGVVLVAQFGLRWYLGKPRGISDICCAGEAVSTKKRAKKLPAGADDDRVGLANLDHNSKREAPPPPSRGGGSPAATAATGKTAPPPPTPAPLPGAVPAAAARGAPPPPPNAGANAAAKARGVPPPPPTR